MNEEAYHAETHSLIRVHEIGEVFACRSNRDTFPVSEFVKTALDAEICFPVLAVGYRHHQCRVDIRQTEHIPAPPAIVPSRYGLISMTFFTVPLARHDERNT
jgi:hypothetical protein